VLTIRDITHLWWSSMTSLLLLVAATWLVGRSRRDVRGGGRFRSVVAELVHLAPGFAW
jgi:hypothetical protein